MPDTNDLWPENIADSNLVHPGVHLETTGRAAEARRLASW